MRRSTASPPSPADFPQHTHGSAAAPAGEWLTPLREAYQLHRSLRDFVVPTEELMAKLKTQASNRPAQHAKLADQNAKQREPEEQDRRDEENEQRFTDQTGRVAQD